MAVSSENGMAFVQTFRSVQHFLSRGADPELASLSLLCLTLHSLHSSVQISKYTSNIFIVLGSQKRKSSCNCHHYKAYYAC